MECVDVAVIGAGVMGCAVARELSRYCLDVLVLERAHDVGEGSSKANSGIVHAGFHPRGGSLKGTSCVQGNALLRKLAADLEVPLISTGAMMVAFDRAGLEKLHEKAARGLENGTGVLEVVGGDEARAMEPRLSPRVMAALLAPSTAVVSPFDYVLALAQNAASNGVQFRFNAEVERMESALGAKAGDLGSAHVPEGYRYLLHLADGTCVAARFVANMAGDKAALLDEQVRPADYEVRPRAGDYLVFDKQDSTNAITHVIYQAQETNEGGTLLAPTVEGNLLAGPTSRNVRRFGDTASTQAGLDHVWRVASKLVPDLQRSQVIANFAGVRTNIVNVSKELKDFVVRVSAPGNVCALGIKNPGLTSSPALALRAVSLLKDEGLQLVLDPTFNPKRKRWVPFLQRSADEQRRLLASDESFGRVICRCESICEGDVRAVMNGEIPPTTMAGLKRRLRLSMGRCQGSFCLPRAVEVMADELGVPACKVPAGEHGGRLVQRSVK